MPRSPVFLFLALAVSFGGTAHAERLAFAAYGTTDGLAGAYVNRVMRDSRGFLWFGTRDGLSRFDGARFVNYGVEHGLGDPTVNDIIESRTGDYWIATNGGGVCRLPPRAPEPTAAAAETGAPLFDCGLPGDRLLANRVNTLHEDGDGQIWVGTDGGLFRLDPARRPYRFEAVAVPVPSSAPAAASAAPGISEVIADNHGGLWIGTHRGLWHRDGAGRIRQYAIRSRTAADDEIVTRLLLDSRGRLWLGLLGGLMVVRPEIHDKPAGGPHRFSLLPQPLNLRDPRHSRHPVRLPETAGERVWMPVEIAGPQGLVRVLFETADGAIWIGTTRGLLHVDVEGEGSSLRSYTTDQGLASSDIRGLAEDGDGNLWIGGTSAAMKLTRRGFVSYTIADGLGDASVHGIFETRAGRLHVVSGDWIINELDNDRFSTVRLGVPAGAVRPWRSPVAMLDRADRWWLLALPELWHLPPTARLADLQGPLPSPINGEGSASDLTFGSVLRIFEDRRGDVWLGLAAPAGRLVRWERATGRIRVFTEADGLPRDVPSAIGEDAHGHLWIGFSSSGLARLDVNDGGAGTRVAVFAAPGGVPPGPVTAVHTDITGRLWIGTARGGVARVDDPAGATPRFTRYTTANGLGSNNIRCLTSDREGRIYAGTPRGVDRLDPATGHVRGYVARDGLSPGLTTAAYRDRQGRLWFGTTHGLSRLDPTSDPPRVPPPVWIGALQIAGAQRPISHLGERDIAAATLAPAENQVDVQFFGLTFAMGETLRYQYRLEGAAGGWSEPTREQRVHYSALAPGQYRFLVRAVSAEGMVSAQPASVPFTVLPPLWQRAWFRVLIAGLIALAATLAYRMRVGQLVEIERVRTRIASDLHDHIGSNLSRVAILSEVVKRQIGAAATEPARHLTEIADSARTLIDVTSDIVWSIDPAHDDLASVIVRVREFASDVLTADGVDWSCEAPLDLDRIPLRPDARRHLLLLLKEGVTNIARHAGATIVRLRIEIEDAQLVAELSDNGRGFLVTDEPPPTARGGHGRQSMRWRAAELGGTLQTISAPGAGTHIRLTVPLRGARGPSHKYARPGSPDVRHDPSR